jgi:hypothetical protein
MIPRLSLSSRARVTDHYQAQPIQMIASLMMGQMRVMMRAVAQTWTTTKVAMIGIVSALGVATRP